MEKIEISFRKIFSLAFSKETKREEKNKDGGIKIEIPLAKIAAYGSAALFFASSRFLIPQSHKIFKNRLLKENISKTEKNK